MDSIGLKFLRLGLARTQPLTTTDGSKSRLGIDSTLTWHFLADLYSILLDESRHRLNRARLFKTRTRLFPTRPITRNLVFLFRIFDKDDDGLISVEELRHIMLSFGEKMTEKELDEMIAEANCDKDGHIDYDGMYFLPGWAEANFLWGATVNSENDFSKNSQNLLYKSPKDGGAIALPAPPPSQLRPLYCIGSFRR